MPRKRVTAACNRASRKAAGTPGRPPAEAEGAAPPSASKPGQAAQSAFPLRLGAVARSTSAFGYLLAAALVYGSLWPLVDVAFLSHRFPAPFLTGVAFWRPFSRVVGGPSEYAANLFTQTYWKHWAGVLALTLLALAAWATAHGILRRFSPGPAAWAATAFSGVVLALAGRWLAVVYILPMLAGLAAAWLYMAIREASRSRRTEAIVVAAGLAVSIPVYVALASGFLYLCLMAALFEWLNRRRPLWSLAWIAAGAAVPYGVSPLYYEPDVPARYLRWLGALDQDAITNGLLLGMYLIVPVWAAAGFFLNRFNHGKVPGRFRKYAGRAAWLAMLAFLGWRLAGLRLDRTGWLYADHWLAEGNPEQALVALARQPDASDPVRFLTAYTLSRAGRLHWEMFHYPQLASSDALLLRDTLWDTYPCVALWRSNLYLELGRVNESQRWAHEALAMEGETPRVLERLALVNVLNGNPATAHTFFRALEKVPFHAARARQYIAALDREPALRSDPLAARIRPLMLTRDYVGDFTTEQILEQSLDANPLNRTAFEYLLAHYLLTFDAEGFARLAPRFKDFYGDDLPTHLQEALLSFENLTGELPPGVARTAIRSQTATRFQNFVFVWTRAQNGPREDAWRVLAPDYGATYWFFYIFGRTAAGPPFQAGDGAPTQKGGPR